jgi:hypothetical protein
MRSTPTVAIGAFSMLLVCAPARAAVPDPPPQGPSSDLVSYWQIVDEYRAGHAGEAMRQIADFGFRRMDRAFIELEAQAKRHEPEGARWSVTRLKAAVVMHTQFALSGAIQLPSERGAHLAFARRLAEMKGAKRRGSEVLPLSFRKRWFLWIAWSALDLTDFALLEQYVDAAEQQFEDDADILLTSASFAEMIAWPKLAAMGDVSAWLRRHGSRAHLLESAETKYRRVLALVPDSIEARLRLGRVLEEHGRPGEALQTLTPVFVAQDSRARYLARLFAGAACEALGRTADARAHYQAAVHERPELATPHVALSHAQWRLGDIGAAMAEAGDALKSGAGNDDPWWAYYFGQGDRAAALGDELIKEALR